MGYMPLMRESFAEFGGVLVDVDGDTLTCIMVNTDGVVRDRFAMVKRGVVEQTAMSAPWQDLGPIVSPDTEWFLGETVLTLTSPTRWPGRDHHLHHGWHGPGRELDPVPGTHPGAASDHHQGPRISARIVAGLAGRHQGAFAVPRGAPGSRTPGSGFTRVRPAVRGLQGAIGWRSPGSTPNRPGQRASRLTFPLR